MEYLKTNPKDDNPEHYTTVKLSEVNIDNITFQVISKTVNLSEQNYIYTSVMYIAEIQGKEFSITCIYDNEIDEEKIKKAIKNSNFNFF